MPLPPSHHQAPSPTLAKAWILCLLAPWLLACGNSGSANPSPSISTQRPPRSGEQLYINCRACHGADGLGIKNVNPPLASSPYLRGDDQTLVKIIRDGYRSGGQWSGIMTGFEGRMSEPEMVTLINWLRQRWAPESADISLQTVRQVTATPARRRPWNSSELPPIPQTQLEAVPKNVSEAVPEQSEP